MIKNKKIKRSSHPIMFFIYLSLLVIVASGIANALNFQVTYDKLTTIVGEVETTTITVNSLLSLDGLKFLITSAYDNLTSFVPFASFLIASIAFAIAYKSGYLKTLFSKITNKFPKYLIVFMYSLICIVSSFDANMGYVLLLPIGAIIFMCMNRNAVCGIALGFSSIAAGHGAGLFITSLDFNLSSYTEASAKLLDSEYLVSQSCNLIFIIVAALLISMVCTFVTEKFMVKKLGRNNLESDEEEIVVEESLEKKGIVAAFISTIIILIPIILMLIPTDGDGFLGLLLDKSQTSYSKMLFSSDALLMTNMVGIVSFILAVKGFVYGVATGSVKRIRDLVNFATSYLKSIGSMFVLIFFASQFVAIVNETNLGMVIVGTLSNIIALSEFSFIPLIILILVFTMLANLLVTGSVAKWAIMAPNIMSSVMKANITPEFAQLVFRVGDSITNCITPVFGYFVIFIGFVEIYTKNKNDFNIRSCYRIIIPYFLAILLIWVLMLVCWYIIGLPIGVGTYPSL